MGGAQNNYVVIKNILAVQSESDTSCSVVQVFECTVLKNLDLNCFRYHSISYILRVVRDPSHDVSHLDKCAFE